MTSQDSQFDLRSVASCTLSSSMEQATSILCGSETEVTSPTWSRRNPSPAAPSSNTRSSSRGSVFASSSTTDSSQSVWSPNLMTLSKPCATRTTNTASPPSSSPTTKCCESPSNNSHC